MKTHQFGRSARFSGAIILLALVALAAAAPMWRGVEAQGSDENLGRQPVSRLLPEVMAVEDITVASGCELTAERYADEARSQILEHKRAPCAVGAIVHSKPMSRRDAEAGGLRYVILTGNRKVDKEAHRALKIEVGQKATPTGRTLGGTPPPIESGAGGCTPTYFSNSMTYYTYDVGATVMVVAAYQNSVNCGYIWITNTSIAFVSPPYPGEDLYWDEEYYNVPNSQWEMGCKRVATWPWQNHETDHYVAANATLTDETINDTSFWCDWWGEEYTSSMVLYN